VVLKTCNKKPENPVATAPGSDLLFGIIEPGMKINAPSWKFKFWRIPHLDDLELFHGLNVTYDYPRHMHEVNSIGLILRGADTTIHRRSSFTAHAGDILLIPAGEVHASRSAGAEYRIIKIGPKTLNRIASEIAGRFST
jgi:mannose-6-phosphate isomerase-like protein (cupin superfamily)